MNRKKSLKPIPQLKSDAAAELFIDEADLAEYDLSEFKPTHFEFEKKDSIVNLRVPSGLLEAVKAKAAKRGIPYQRLIREGMEKVVQVQPSGVTWRTHGKTTGLSHYAGIPKKLAKVVAAFARKASSSDSQAAVDQLEGIVLETIQFAHAEHIPDELLSDMVHQLIVEAKK
jgi:predicted DNA binding CopG/RHH family protein